MLQIKMHIKRGELESLSWELFKKNDLQAGSTNRGWLLASTERFPPGLSHGAAQFMRWCLQKTPDGTSKEALLHGVCV